MREVTITRTLSAPVGLIVHSLTEVNTKLYKGNPFFSDIVVQGIGLYEAEGHPLSKPGKLPMGERLTESRKHFDYWFGLSLHGLKLARDSIVDGVPRDAAFMFIRRLNGPTTASFWLSLFTVPSRTS